MNIYQNLNLPLPSSLGGYVNLLPFSLADYIREDHDSILHAFADCAKKHSWPEADIQKTLDAITPENIGTIIPSYLDPVYIDQ